MDECDVWWFAYICETFVGIQFFVSNFGLTKSGHEKNRIFWGIFFDFIFLENKTNWKSDSDSYKRCRLIQSL